MSRTTAVKKPKVTSACTRCTGLCCRYFALPLDNPEDWKDYDDIRWFLCHEHTSVFVEKGQWYININNKCRHLADHNHRCTMYELRPKVCRTYHTGNCDKVGQEYDYELHFTSDKQMEEYMRIKFGAKVFGKLETFGKKKAKKKSKAKA